MKQLFISLLFACLPAVAPAQDEGMTDRYSVATNTFWSNWFVSGGVGWGAWYGGVEDGRGWSKSPLRGFRSGPGLSLALGKWFTPGLGLRTRLSGVWGKAVWSDAGAGNGNKYWMLNEQVMFNLTDMLCGYDPGRLWHFIPFIGAGVARSCTYNRYSAGLGAGILNEFRVSRRLAVSFEVGWNRFENDLAGMPAAAGRGFMDHQNQFYAEAGITFRLGRKTWEAAADVSAISEMTQTELDALNAMLADERADNERLRSLHADAGGDVRPTDSQAAAGIPAPAAVFFNIGEAEPADRRGLVNVEPVARYAAARNATVLVAGYADSATGSPERNRELSRQRAEKVAAVLADMGVKPENIRVEARGGVDTYAEASFNRRVIVEIVSSEPQR